MIKAQHFKSKINTILLRQLTEIQNYVQKKLQPLINNLQDNRFSEAEQQTFIIVFVKSASNIFDFLNDIQGSYIDQYVNLFKDIENQVVQANNQMDNLESENTRLLLNSQQAEKQMQLYRQQGNRQHGNIQKLIAALEQKESNQLQSFLYKPEKITVNKEDEIQKSKDLRALLYGIVKQDQDDFASGQQIQSQQKNRGQFDEQEYKKSILSLQKELEFFKRPKPYQEQKSIQVNLNLEEKRIKKLQKIIYKLTNKDIPNVSVNHKNIAVKKELELIATTLQIINEQNDNSEESSNELLNSQDNSSKTSSSNHVSQPKKAKTLQMMHDEIDLSNVKAKLDTGRSSLFASSRSEFSNGKKYKDNISYLAEETEDLTYRKKQHEKLKNKQKNKDDICLQESENDIKILSDENNLKSQRQQNNAPEFKHQLKATDRDEAKILESMNIEAESREKSKRGARFKNRRLQTDISCLTINESGQVVDNNILEQKAYEQLKSVKHSIHKQYQQGSQSDSTLNDDQIQSVLIQQDAQQIQRLTTVRHFIFPELQSSKSKVKLPTELEIEIVAKQNQILAEKQRLVQQQKLSEKELLAEQDVKSQIKPTQLEQSVITSFPSVHNTPKAEQNHQEIQQPQQQKIDVNLREIDEKISLPEIQLKKVPITLEKTQKVTKPLEKLPKVNNFFNLTKTAEKQAQQPIELEKSPEIYKRGIIYPKKETPLPDTYFSKLENKSLKVYQYDAQTQANLCQCWKLNETQVQLDGIREQFLFLKKIISRLGTQNPTVNEWQAREIENGRVQAMQLTAQKVKQKRQMKMK